MPNSPLDSLLRLIYRDTGGRSWEDAAREAFQDACVGRYGKSAAKKVALRVNPQDGAPFAAWIAPDQPPSGAYGGMSFVVFPGSATEPTVPARFGLVVGTNGLHPDQDPLSRPGHARKVRAICAAVNAASHSPVAWAKRDPTRVDQTPSLSDRAYLDPDESLSATLAKYGGVCYSLIAPPQAAESPRSIADGLAMLLDVFFQERGIAPLAAWRDHADSLRSVWLEHVFPSTSSAAVKTLLEERRFVVLQGPPGTGKTRMALELASDSYGRRATVVQFHPAVTYESFVGGLAPVPAAGPTGLQFKPEPGTLMRATAAAREDPRPYLLVIDEVNRADLGKVLGEAIYLLEPGEPDRRVDLTLDYGPPFGTSLQLPENLHILGTMNTADRSIALLDVAVRRRFAFLDVWPQMDLACDASRQEFEDLANLFFEFARDRELALLPGHSYFMEHGGDPRTRLRTELRPLLQEYLDQGLAAGFADQLQSFVDRLDATTTSR